MPEPSSTATTSPISNTTPDSGSLQPPWPPTTTGRQARALGLKHYFLGVRCTRGHLTWRRVCDRQCIECHRIEQAIRTDTIQRVAAKVSARALTAARREVVRELAAEARERTREAKRQATAKAREAAKQVRAAAKRKAEREARRAAKPVAVPPPLTALSPPFDPARDPDLPPWD